MSNTIIIHKAHLGREPELRTTSSGKKVLNLRIAEATRRDEDSEWYSVSVWGARADALSTLLKQGSKIGVVGRLKVRRYDHNGEKRFSFEIDASEIILLDSRSDSPQADAAIIYININKILKKSYYLIYLEIILFALQLIE